MAETSLRAPAPDRGGGQPDGGADRVPLSFQQQFLTEVDHGDGLGPFGPHYTIVGGWRVSGEVHLATLRAALDDVVARHEALRTRIVLDDGEPYQTVVPPVSPSLEVHDLEPGCPVERDRCAEEFVNEVEAGTFGLHEVPLVRALLGRFDRDNSVLVLAAHHTAVDGWSVHVVVRDLAECYAARREHRAPHLPPVRQYREYVTWQRANGAPAAARAFWRDTLRGQQVVTIPTDMPRRDHEPFETGWHRFMIGDPLRSAALTLAEATHSSPFMVLFAAYLVSLRESSGRSDLVVPTFTPGRTPAWVHDTVGSFYNLLPLRADIGGSGDFAAVVARTRAACLATYPHEVPFMQLAEEAPELMRPAMEPDAALCVFQVTQSPHVVRGAEAGGLRYTAIRKRELSQPAGSQIPDGVLFGLELHPQGLVGSIGYTTNLFTERTIAAMASHYTRVLSAQLGCVG
ncbi:MAG TPA: condensation domain-containing protein [Streptosporangiaceae bacterium]|nr:condensation domain-containing protein [Streptosporangiaceae bacterium]